MITLKQSEMIYIEKVYFSKMTYLLFLYFIINVRHTSAKTIPLTDNIENITVIGKATETVLLFAIPS